MFFGPLSLCSFVLKRPKLRLRAVYISTSGSNLVREIEQNVGFAAASGLGNG
jgi:hypothetical protein